MTPIRVGVVCDLREEGWHSMDLVADMLMETLPEVAGSQVVATRLCPAMVPRWSRLPLVGRTARAKLGDRLMGRLWDYPRYLTPRAHEFDLFHIVDHSYAHLVRVLPAERTIVTCHDLDGVEAALRGPRKLLDPARLLASRILEGLERAAHIACDSQATRAELVATGHVRPERVSVVYVGVHPSCSPDASSRWDGEIAERLGPKGLEILHVGSTIPRKRIDVLLHVLRGVRATFSTVRLLRVGGPLTPAQRELAATLGVTDALVELPFMERPALAALYRRASLVVLPSEREGFGLPIVEAMACGTPVVASAIPALQEIGGTAATYCPAGEIDRWIHTVTELLRQKQDDTNGWERRRQGGIAWAAKFDWRTYAAEMTQRYLQISGTLPPAVAGSQAS